MLIVALAALLSTQAPPPDPSTAAPAPAPAPLPPATAPPPPVEAPPTGTEPLAPEAPRPDAKKAVAPHNGMNPWAVGGIQWLTGCGASVVQLPCNLCTCGLWGCTVEPAINGYAETYAGDALGDNRAAAIWPIVAAYAAGTIGAIVTVAINLTTNSTAATLSSGNATTIFSNPVLLAGALANLGVGVAVGLVVPITYALVDVPKQPGDDGSGFPGLLEPAGPKAPPIKTKVDVGKQAMTMAF